MQELICFDMDNTLVYANKLHIIAYNRAFIKNGLPPVNEEKLKSLFGIIGYKLIKILFPKLKIKDAKKIQKDHNKIAVKLAEKYIKPVKGAKTALKKLRKKYILALITNCSKEEVNAILKAAGIEKNIFKVIVSNEMTKRPKPAPDPVIYVIKKVGVKKGYMVGDTIYDIKAGKKAGLKTIGLLTGNQPEKILKKEKPNIILKSVAELPKYLC